MEIRPEIALLVVACGVVTLVPRVLPFLLLRGAAFPRWIREWLSFIPVTVMSALVAQELIPADGAWDASADKILAALACLVCAIASRSLFLTVVVGVAVVAGLGFL